MPDETPNFHPVRRIEELVRLDPSELTADEKSRLRCVRYIPEAVRKPLLERYGELLQQVKALEAEMDQISDFLQGFWSTNEEEAK